jgi:glycogen phosphorylase
MSFRGTWNALRKDGTHEDTSYEHSITATSSATLRMRYSDICRRTDLTSYVRAREQVGALYAQPEAWARKAILNVGHAGKFSSDRTMAEYAADP